MLMMMKGHGKGEGSVDTGSWYHITSPPRRGKGHGEKKQREKTEEEPPEPGQKPGGGGDGGGPGAPSDNTPTDPTEESDESSINTSEVRSMLRRRARGGPDRPKSSLGSVKIVEFYGERSRYLKWKRAVQAQQQLYKLEEEELAMLIYLSTKKDARDCLDQMAISEFTRLGGLRLVWKLLDEGFGESEDELFERAEQEFNTYRRLPGQSIATYVGQLKRLRAQYQRVDPETHISDRAWSQRMLNRASLSRRERLDVFFSAGGKYQSRDIETALRHRCAKTHEEERRLPRAEYTRFTSNKRMKVLPMKAKKGDGKSKHRTYVVDGEEDEDRPEEEEEEDLEKDEEAYRTYLEYHEEDPELEDIPEEDEGDMEEEEELQEEELKEAWAAGWRAKAQQSDRKKFRGWKGSSKGSSKGAQEDKRKVGTTCSSCWEVGHWKGDPQCKNVKNGKDKPHIKRSPSSSNTSQPAPNNTIHFTYVVTQVDKKVKVEAEGRDHHYEERPNEKTCMNPTCRFPVREVDRFCSRCGTRVPGDARMTDKRQWKIITEEDDVETITSSSVSDGERAKQYPIRKGTLREAAQISSKPEDDEQKVKVTAEEMLAALPKMSRDEKRALKHRLLKEEEQTAWETYCRHRAEWEYAVGQDEDGRPSGIRGSEDTSQRPIPPPQAFAAAKSRAQGYMTDARDPSIPKKVKERKLADFRKSLYDEQWDGKRLIPSTCAPVPSATQTRCNHPFDQLRWSANADGHYARCKKCDLKHVIYYHERHGVMMTKREQEAYIAGNPGEAIADSGCRCAVAGGAWHEKFQAELRRLGMTWHEEEEDETFRFGSGPPERSSKAYIYPVGIHGMNDVVRMSKVEGGAMDCPGLLGPSELSRWQAVARFGERTLELKGVVQPMKLTSTRHPAINLLEYQDGTLGSRFWIEEIQKKVQILQRNPQTWAFLANPEHEEDSSSETQEESEETGEEDMAEENKTWRKWMQKLDEHLHTLPLKNLRQTTTEEDSAEEDTSEGSISSHEFGVEEGAGSEEDTEEEMVPEDEYEARYGSVKIMSKHLKRKIGHHVKELKESFEEELQRKTGQRQGCQDAEAFLAKEPGWKNKKKEATKGRPLRVLEIFTWTCMISICAAERGWQAFEPITLPRWDIKDKQQQHEALRYLDQVDPDLLVIAWPCRYWSILQQLSCKTWQDHLELGERRQEERERFSIL